MIRSLWLEQIEGAAIRDLDPLGLDGTFRELPAINRSGDQRALRRVLEAAAASATARSLSTWEALAAVRDLGMLVASLRRLASTPDFLPERVEAALVQLGRATDMPPRETVVHYAHWNPGGSRRRTFTGSPEEVALITVTSRCLRAFENAIRALLQVRQEDPAAASYAHGCQVAAAELAVAARAVQSRASNLDARHFATALRPYFEPVVIDGRSYSAAAAAQAPLYLVDECLFGRSAGDAATWQLRDELAEYGLPRWRAAYQEARHGSSIVERLMSVDHGAAGEAAAVEAVGVVLDQLLSFRGRHRPLVATAYKHTASGFGSGSAGADLHLIDNLLLATRKQHRRTVTLRSGHDSSHLRQSRHAPNPTKIAAVTVE